MSTNLLDLKIIRMIYFIIFVLLIWVWIIVEWINAPTINDDTKQDKDDSTIEPNDTNSKGV
jgi:hypothetical protein